MRKRIRIVVTIIIVVILSLLLVEHIISGNHDNIFENEKERAENAARNLHNAFGPFSVPIE